MKNLLESHWNELQKKLPAEQIFYLFIMLAFTEYRKKQLGVVCESKDVEPDDFLGLFQDIPQYDLKEAVFRFCEKVDWLLLENNREIQMVLKDVRNLIFWLLFEDMGAGKKSDIQKLDELLEDILELTGTAGEYVATPYSIRELTKELLSDIKPRRMADLCCGTAVFGVGMWEALSQKRRDIWFYGAEIDSVLSDIGRILLFLHGIEGQIDRKDLLSVLTKKAEQQKSQFGTTGEPDSRYDLIVMDIPRGNNKSIPYDERDLRLQDFNRKTIYSDWIFIQDALYHLNDGGYAAVLCTNGTLIRANEKLLREKIVVHDWLEAVISLPANLYPNTGTGTELLIFHKGKAPSRTGQILFVDISRYYFREKRNSHSISEEGRKLVCSAFKKYQEIKGVSVIRKTGTMDFQTFSFKPMQYIQQEMEGKQGETICLSEVAEIVRGAQITSKDIQNDIYSNRYSNIPGLAASDMAYFINIKDIQNDRIVYGDAEKISMAHPACKKKFRIQEDDLLITSKGTAIKITIVEPDPPPAFISGNLTLLRVDKKKYDPYVLFAYLNSGQGRIELERIQSGTTIRILNNANLKELKIPKYDQGLMERVGTRLKRKQEQFYKEQETLQKNYQNEKRMLLDLLKEEL